MKKKKLDDLQEKTDAVLPEDPAAQSDDSPETDDAKAKEMVAYALGGVAGQIANSDMWLKQNLLMYVLRINPMLIAFLGVFGSIWDAITDPIMANISDNAKTRWGRRRPFILVGGLLATIFSVLIWANFPKNDKIVKNVKVFPEVVQSQDALEKFGHMMKGYAINSTKLTLMLDEPVERDPENIVNNIDDLLKASLGKIGAGVSLAEDDPDALPLSMITEGFGPDRLDVELVGQTLSIQLTLGDQVAVSNAVRIEKDYPQRRGFRERSGDLFNGRTVYMGLAFDGEQIDFKHNSYEKRGIYRARIALLEKSIIEALGEYYNLPYWKCFPEKDDKGKITLREAVTLGALANADPAGLTADDAEIYNPLVDTFISFIEKRKKYNTLRTAQKTETVDAETEKLLAPLLDTPEDWTEVRDGLLDGELSRKAAGLLNRKCLVVTDAEIAAARAQLAGDPYQNYIALHSKFLLYGLGYNMDMLQPRWTEADQAEVQTLMTEENLSGLEELYAFLWSQNDELLEATREQYVPGTLGLLNYMKIDEMLGRYINPAFKGKKPGNIEKFKEGMRVFGQNPQDDKIAIYMIVALIVMATFGTIRSVPYYALGIELAPSYNGRTKVIALRSVMGQIISLMNPWLFPLVLLPIFSDAIDGAMWVGIVCGVISIPMLIYSVRTVKERTVLDKKRKKVSFFKSIRQTASVPEFWRVLTLFILLQKTLGLVNMATGYLIIYWVFDGALKAGASYLAGLQTIGFLMGILSLPLITWICNKFQKHNALRFSVIMLICNALLSWVCYNPDRPYLMFILPFFGSVGITSMYTVMGTLMADVTDVDELKNGSRREGMFGAVNAMVMKATAPIGAIMASVVVVLSGFDVDMGIHQEAGVFTSMRLWLVILPVVGMSIALLLLHKYPLTRDRMSEIKAELKHRHERIAREEAEAEAEAETLKK